MSDKFSGWNQTLPYFFNWRVLPDHVTVKTLNQVIYTGIIKQYFDE